MSPFRTVKLKCRIVSTFGCHKTEQYGDMSCFPSVVLFCFTFEYDAAIKPPLEWHLKWFPL